MAPIVAVAAFGSTTPEPARGSALVGIEAFEGGDARTLLCRSAVDHRVREDLGRLLLTVEPPGALNAVPPGTLPSPDGAVRAIWTGEDCEATRRAFAPDRRVRASAPPVERGVEVRLRHGAAVPAEAEKDRKTLGTEDLIEISVFEVPEMNRTVRVSEAGTVSLPLIGDVKAAGLTPREFEMSLRERLAERFVHDPQVSVFVQEHGSRRVSVLGAVGKPGVYEMLGPRTLLQVLALAGGLTQDAGGELYVIRSGAGGRIPVAVRSLIVSEDPALNLEILPGDVVSVPQDPTLYMYVDGAVRSPGRIEQRATSPITLLQALAKAGGATDRANLRRIHILRRGAGGTQASVTVNVNRIRKGVDPDPVLQDGDVVVVPETFF